VHNLIEEEAASTMTTTTTMMAAVAGAAGTAMTTRMTIARAGAGAVAMMTMTIGRDDASPQTSEVFLWTAAFFRRFLCVCMASSFTHNAPPQCSAPAKKKRR
jgi:hypothetical protein